MEGIIYKGIGGFYYVKTTDGTLIECKPRGLFRKQGIKPLPGDRVVLEQEAGTQFIATILPRKNALIRPPVANVDQVFIVASTIEPVPSFLVLDKLMAYALALEAEPFLLITKTDLAPPQPLQQAYATSGIPVITLEEGSAIEKISSLLCGKLSIFAGNSGVGKSTLLNQLLPDLQRETGEISQKLGRGRHTTREVEIFQVAGGLLADTPGFASFDLQSVSPILSKNLQLYFPEIKERIGQCKFSGCTHTTEKGCAVLQALADQKIAQSRHQSYVTLFQQAKQGENKF